MNVWVSIIIISFLVISCVWYKTRTLYEKRILKHANQLFCDNYYVYAKRNKQWELFGAGFLLVILGIIGTIEPKIALFFIPFYLGIPTLLLYHMHKWRHSYIKLKDYRLIYKKTRNRRLIINLANVTDVRFYPLWTTVRIHPNHTIRLPNCFEKPAELGAVLKYHRPENRRRVSTRNRPNHANNAEITASK